MGGAAWIGAVDDDRPPRAAERAAMAETDRMAAAALKATRGDKYAAFKLMLEQIQESLKR